MGTGLLHPPRATATRAERRAVAAVSAAAPLVVITAVGALLRLWAFDRVGANPFYDAAVRSMSVSWHDFFFGAFEPGGQVSIDKAPGDLWLQVASTKVLGFTGVTTRLPEVTAGVLAIPLLYDLVRRLFGRVAGLGAAAALAVLPAAILTAHSDTMDSLMMLLDLSAAWLVVVGAQSRRAWLVVAAGAVLGLAFNIKLFEGLIIAPALVLLMIFAVDLPVRRRIVVLSGSLAAFVAVSLSWIVAASTVPVSGRPWPIGSTDGSVWSVIFGFNGIDRLRSPASAAALKLDPPGLLRLFGSAGRHYATTVGSMLLAALVLGTVAVAAPAVRERLAGDARRLRLAGAVFFGAWLLVGGGLLSTMQRMQPRYLEAVTPAIAGVVGAGIARLATGGARGRWAAAVLVVVVAGVVAGGGLIAHGPAWAVLLGLAGVVACALAAALPGLPRRSAALAACALLAVLAVPGSAAIMVARAHQSDAGLPSRMSPAEVAHLSRFLIAHQHGARYELASPTVARVAPLIVRDARPVLMLTSIHGRPLLGARRLEQLVAGGQVRYALLGGGACPGGGTRGCAPAVRWAVAHAHDVGGAAGLPHRLLYRLTLTPATRP